MSWGGGGGGGGGVLLLAPTHIGVALGQAGQALPDQYKPTHPDGLTSGGGGGMKKKSWHQD